MARTEIATITPSVTAAVTGAAAGEASAGTSVILPTMVGDSITGISIRTVPATVGVKMRRNRDSLAASTN